MIRPAKALPLALALLFGAGCNAAPPEPTVSVKTIPGHDSLPEDTTTKEAPRLVHAEAYMRTYLMLFGGLAPIDAQTEAQKSGTALFDKWNDYLMALGFPDYRDDIPRQGQTNAVMVAAFERLGVALCDRALEADLKAMPAPPVDKRLIFAFDPPAGVPDHAAFASGFDVLHRTFLGYPVALAPTDRVARYFKLYNDVVASRSATGAPKLVFTPAEAGWAAMCYGLIRHPEFHLY